MDFDSTLPYIVAITETCLQGVPGGRVADICHTVAERCARTAQCATMEDLGTYIAHAIRLRADQEWNTLNVRYFVLGESDEHLTGQWMAVKHNAYSLAQELTKAA